MPDNQDLPPLPEPALQGWQWVPVEPTEEMLLAVRRDTPAAASWREKYRAMLAAAPAATVQASEAPLACRAPLTIKERTMADRHCIFAWTETNVPEGFPGYVNISRDETGKHTITVRSRGNAGRDMAIVEIPPEALESMLCDLAADLYRDDSPAGTSGVVEVPRG